MPRGRVEGRDAGPPLSDRAFVGLTVAACLLFAGYAGSFLYFFVDDEAIPLVYARNLLRGRGLIYTALEGRSEGYSDFLHVLWSTVVLAFTQTVHLSRLAPLVIGKGVSFAAGIGILVCTAGWLRRAGANAQGLTAALAFLALSGPLAVWSCSSLETAVFALMVIGFAGALWSDAQRPAVLLGIAMVFERLDGVLFVAALLTAVLVAVPGRRREVWNIAWPVVVVSVAFHVWRLYFFGFLLSEPLAAKVLYRLRGTAHAIVKPDAVPYLLGWLRLYGVTAAPAFVTAVAVAWRIPAARMGAVALLLLGVYVSAVGDWMFGWRFTVALLPLAALIVGLAVSRAPRRLGWGAAALVTVWSAAGARTCLNAYITEESRPIFWTHPRLGARAWLAPYYDLIGAGRRLMRAGDRVAYNQAGLLPYLLDLENIDDLGICSRFVAHLPTTDVYYTGVGRYSPLTDQPVLRTAHTYLLYQDVQFLISRTDLLWKANGNRIPAALLDGLFSLAAVDARGVNAIYRRTNKAADGYRRDSTLFWENIAHTSRLTRAAIDGKALAPEAIGPELPFLRERSGTRTFNRDLEIALRFGHRDADVYALYIRHIELKQPGTLTLALFDGTGRETLRRTIPVGAANFSVLERFDTPARAVAALLRVDAAEGDSLTIEDVRIEGQSASLREYLRRELRFP